MDKHYADTVRLLLDIAPEVFANDIFAMKGGTAINLFVQDMPRLSVDIDVVYLPWQESREQALQAINQDWLRLPTGGSDGGADAPDPQQDWGHKMIAENEISQVKVVVYVVFRAVCSGPSASLECQTPDLSGGVAVPTLTLRNSCWQLVAAMDRQHHRDLFAVWRLFESGEDDRREGRVLRRLSAGHTDHHDVCSATTKTSRRVRASLRLG
jgi:hypothetical protein